MIGSCTCVDFFLRQCVQGIGGMHGGLLLVGRGLEVQA